METAFHKTLRSWGLLLLRLLHLPRPLQVVSCAQEVSEHAASLLATLNLLRCRALFCDCVVREGGNSAHLYPAHRCVLAASSPVFAALLASSGALLELHDPRLPAAVLVHVLDYIYTGVVPSLGGPQLFYRLLGAAEYLQMDGLLEALRAGPTDDGGIYTRAGYGFYSDSKFWEAPVKPLDKSSNQYTANTEDYMEPHHVIHTTNKISCIKLTEVNTASSDDGHSNAKSDINPRSEQTTCLNVISSPVIRAKGQEQSWRSQEREQSHRYQIHSTREQRRSQKTRERKKNLRTRVNTRKHLCLALTYKQREKLQRNEMEDTKVGISAVSRMTNASTCSPAPPDPNPVPLHNKSPPPLPHRSQPVIHHSSEALPQASLLVGYTTHARRTPCGCPQSTAEEEERTPRSNETEYTDDGGPTADTEQDGRQSRDLRSENPMEDTAEVQDQNTLDYVRERCDVYEACLKGNMVSNRLFKGDCEDVPLVTGLSPGSENYHANTFPRWVPVSEESHGHHDGFYSLQSTFDFVKGSLSTSYQPEKGSSSCSDQSDKEKEHPGSCPLQEFNIWSDPQISSAPPVDKASNHTYNNTEERSYLGHLRYHYLPSKPSHLMEKHLHSNQEDRPSSNPNQSPKGEQFYGREPGAKLLFLDISSRSVQLQVFHKNRVRENGSGYEGCGAAGGESREGWAEAGPQALVEEPYTGVRVSPGVGINPHVRGSHAIDIRCDVDMCSDETRTQAGQETGGAACRCSPGTLSKMDDQGYDLATSLTTSAAALMPLTSLSLSTPSGPPTGRSSTESQQLYQCSLCERSFSQRGSLNRHVRSHLGVRPYLCPRCPMTFSRQYRVTEHMRVHERCVLEATTSRPPES